MDAWQPVGHQSFGPVDLFMRRYRFELWPDKHRADMVDGCGVAPTEKPGELLLTSGTSERWRYRVLAGEKKALGGEVPANTRWDNHLARA